MLDDRAALQRATDAVLSLAVTLPPDRLLAALGHTLGTWIGAAVKVGAMPDEQHALKLLGFAIGQGVRSVEGLPAGSVEAPLPPTANDNR